MKKEDLLKLLQKYNAGTCTEAEKAILESWYLQYEDPEWRQLSETERAADLEEIRASLPAADRHPGLDLTYFTRMAAAAAILILAGVVTWFVSRQQHQRPLMTAQLEKQDIAPGGNKATLTLGDGSVITLDDAAKGAIAEQAGITISKTAEGQLIYAASGQGEKFAGPIRTNTVETPRGGQYQVELPDGTKVWLNAASSLRYPALFTGKERRVELSGEAYFEVAHNKDMPFRVESQHQVVEVLGTHFNINSYADEPIIKTTLLEGSVRVSGLQAPVSEFLKPGQQAVLSNGSMKIAKVNAQEAVAWKNGYIVFENEKITSLMKKIARWYDVDIVYQGQVTDNNFNGSVSRFDNVSKVLEILELTKAVHFKVEGRKIIVMP